MSILTMDMSSYEIERSETSGYDDEMLNVGWVPELGLREVCSEHVDLPPAMPLVNVDEFLNRMRRNQR